MFGFLKRNSQPDIPPRRFTPEQVAAINQQLSEFAEGEILPVEAALTKAYMHGNRYYEVALEKLSVATVKLVLAENNPRSAPLSLKAADGSAMLALFTQHSRTLKMTELHPQYRYYLELPFRAALHSLAEGTGIVINPCHEVISWTMPPDLVRIVKGVIPAQPLRQGQPPPLPKYRPGQVWKYKDSAYEPDACFIVLRAEPAGDGMTLIHIAVTGLKLPNGGSTIGHMPFSEEAIDRSVKALIRENEPLPHYGDGYRKWQAENGGFFTIPVAEGVACTRKMLVSIE